MPRGKLLAGTRGGRAVHVELTAIVGKTIQGVVRTTVPSDEGDEPCIQLLFTDGTEHGFVLPRDSQDE